MKVQVVEGRVVVTVDGKTSYHKQDSVVGQVMLALLHEVRSYRHLREKAASTIEDAVDHLEADTYLSKVMRGGTGVREDLRAFEKVFNTLPMKVEIA